MKNIALIILTLFFLTACSPVENQSTDYSHEVSETESTEKAYANTDEKNTAGIYVGSVKSNVYHYPDCVWVKNIYKENEIFFESEEDAISSGYRACRSCVEKLVLPQK